MNKEVNLTKRVKTPSGPRFCPVVISDNGRVKPDVVLVDGKEERHPEGRYYIDWTDGKRRIRKSVGKDAAAAGVARHRQEQILASRAAGLKVVADGSGTPLLNAAALYLDEIKAAKKPKTYNAYNKSLEYFLQSCKKQNIEEIERGDILRFSAYLRDTKKLSPRTVHNKFENVLTFLKSRGIRDLVKKNDWPRFVEDEPEIYEREDLNEFFAACEPDERVWFEFFLMTGMREQEVRHGEWPDVNLTRGVVNVRYKQAYGFSPKGYKGREVPIPNKLVASLKKAKAKAKPDCTLLFPTSGGRPKLDFLDCCKAIADRAGFDPADFWLHKFRATFATWHLWAGVDLRTVQAWMGHTDLQSTMRYLKPNKGEAVRDKVNAAFD